MSGVIRIVANFCDCRFSRFYVDQVGFASPLVSFGLWSYEYLIRSKRDRILRREPQHDRLVYLDVLYMGIGGETVTTPQHHLAAGMEDITG